jgi:hypothetical protein
MKLPFVKKQREIPEKIFEEDVNQSQRYNRPASIAVTPIT